jgi:hypothetical protein
MNKLHMKQYGEILIRKLDNKTKDAVCHIGSRQYQGLTFSVKKNKIK